MLKKSATPDKLLIVYHYFENDQTYIDNFSHFLRFGYSIDLNYVVIIAGSCQIQLPKATNIQYFFSRNKNFDFGGYAQAIMALQFDHYYDFFVFINSSVRGPFLPSYASANWVESLIKLFEDDVGIVGAAISLTPSNHSIAKLYHAKYGVLPINESILSHVQSTCYVLSQQTLRYLISSGFYNESKALSKDETVCNYEIRLSQLILSQSLNLKCILPEYNQPDYRTLIHEINPSSREGDSGFINSYFGRTAHPYEAMFIKTSRNTFPDAYLKQLAHSMAVKIPIDRNISNSKIIEEYSFKYENSFYVKNLKEKKYYWKKLWGD